MSLYTVRLHRFFEWLSIDHPHNNVHNIRLCRLITQSGALSARELADLRVVDRVSAAILYRHCSQHCSIAFRAWAWYRLHWLVFKGTCLCTMCLACSAVDIATRTSSKQRLCTALIRSGHLHL